MKKLLFMFSMLLVLMLGLNSCGDDDTSQSGSTLTIQGSGS